jgi:hypothetical protein
MPWIFFLVWALAWTEMKRSAPLLLAMTERSRSERNLSVVRV